jgi:hypothetical protein
LLLRFAIALLALAGTLPLASLAIGGNVGAQGACGDPSPAVSMEEMIAANAVAEQAEKLRCQGGGEIGTTETEPMESVDNGSPTK